MAEAVAARCARLVGRAPRGRGRPAAADPDPARALVARIGYGTGEQVADGAWDAARELPPARRPAAAGAAARPTERLAALLGGRDAAARLRGAGAARPRRPRPRPRARGRAPARGCAAAPRWPSSRAGASTATSRRGWTSWRATRAPVARGGGRRAREGAARGEREHGGGRRRRWRRLEAALRARARRDLAEPSAASTASSSSTTSPDELHRGDVVVRRRALRDDRERARRAAA